MADCKKTWKKAFDIFAIDTWVNGMENIMILYKLKAKLAKRGFFMKLLLDSVKVLEVDYDLTTLTIQEKIFFILEVILLIVKNKDY